MIKMLLIIIVLSRIGSSRLVQENQTKESSSVQSVDHSELLVYLPSALTCAGKHHITGN